MKNSTKDRDTSGQLRRACEEMARGFAQMETTEEITPDTWGEAVSALTETLTVARAQWVTRVQWAELVAELVGDPEMAGRHPSPVSQYSVQLLDAKLEPMAGASFDASSDDEAEAEARALALMHGWARLALVVHKYSGRTWSIEVQ